MQFAIASADGVVKFKAAVAAAGPGNEKTGERMLSDLSLYTTPPMENITLEEFERLALARLSVLKEMEAHKLRNPNKEDSELLVKLNALKAKHMKGALVPSSASASTKEEEARADLISHYVLRLAYCRTAELRKWFLAQECEMFRLKFSKYEAAEHEAFLAVHAPQYKAVDSAEFESVRDDVYKVMHSCLESKDIIQRTMAAPHFYKVAWTRVPELVSQRRVLLRRGFAYVSREALAPLVVAEFRASVSKGLSDMARRWRQMFPAEEEQRLQPLVASLANRSLVADYSGVATKYGDVSAASLQQLSARHFPLCMGHLMTQLHAEKHLRHGGRQQLGLFLKGIGLPMEEALLFWRSEFAPRTPNDQFDKQYAYNIRHNYGREGKRTDYTAHKCTTIVCFSGGPGDHHGCPYRRLDETQLRQALGRLKCEDRKIEEAVAKAREGHYQLACASAFEGIHRVPEMDVGVSAPLQYYTESRRIHAEREATAAQGAGAAAAGAGAGAAAGTGPGAAGAGAGGSGAGDAAMEAAPAGGATPGAPTPPQRGLKRGPEGAPLGSTPGAGR